MKELQLPRRDFGQCFTPTRFAHDMTCNSDKRDSVSLSEFNNPLNLLRHGIIRGFADRIDARDYRVDVRGG
jgi:hypothetical protein